MKFKVGKRISEANIQAEIYHRLKQEKIYSYLEYKYENCRFDIVVPDLKKEKVLVIIEVKSKIRTSPTRRKTKQQLKYERFGVPVLYCNSMEDVASVIDKVKSLIGKE